jgi:hypothetical protein
LKEGTEMRLMLNLAIAMLLLLAGYNYGLRAGMAKNNVRADNYKALYYQCLQWKELK